MSHYLMAILKTEAGKRNDAACSVLRFRRLDNAREMV